MTVAGFEPGSFDCRSIGIPALSNASLFPQNDFKFFKFVFISIKLYYNQIIFSKDIPSNKRSSIRRIKQLFGKNERALEKVPIFGRKCY